MRGQPASLAIDWEHFLAHHWQREPLLVRQALTDWTPPLDADSLAGLALEADIESRIIEHVDDEWRLQHGPFEPGDFERDTPWTLLVQAVDHYVPEVAMLQQLFTAIPPWRMDDVMVSYASPGGSVGPHYDQYDVFLLQGEGHRHWQLGQHCDAGSELAPQDDLRILAQFDCESEFLLEPGDMLYVPPGVAHWGIAKDECTTFSIGFRAPRVPDMLSRRVDALLEQSEPDRFYSDPDRKIATRAGEIRSEDLARAHAQIQEQLETFTDTTWFGELVTEPRYQAAYDESLVTTALHRLDSGAARISIPAAASVAWQALSPREARVFANGQSRVFDAAVVSTVVELCAGNTMDCTALQTAPTKPHTSALLAWLVECGGLDVE